MKKKKHSLKVKWSFPKNTSSKYCEESYRPAQHEPHKRCSAEMSRSNSFCILFLSFFVKSAEKNRQYAFSIALIIRPSLITGYMNYDGLNLIYILMFFK